MLLRPLGRRSGRCKVAVNSSVITNVNHVRTPCDRAVGELPLVNERAPCVDESTQAVRSAVLL